MRHPHEELIRRLYAARARDDQAEVRAILADDVVWHEPGPGDYTGDLRGADAVLRMHAKALELTAGSFRLELHDVLANDEHAVALVVWSARRGDRALTGREVAVYHVRHGRVSEAWFHPDNQAVVEAFWA